MSVGARNGMASRLSFRFSLERSSLHKEGWLCVASAVHRLLTRERYPHSNLRISILCNAFCWWSSTPHVSNEAQNVHPSGGAVVVSCPNHVHSIRCRNAPNKLTKPFNLRRIVSRRQHAIPRELFVSTPHRHAKDVRFESKRTLGTLRPNRLLIAIAPWQL